MRCEWRHANQIQENAGADLEGGMKASRSPVELPSRMLPTDALFWYAEQAAPSLRPVVAGLLMLDHEPDPRRFRLAIQRLLARVPRLTQRVRTEPLPFTLPAWEDDPHFDLNYHVREIALPAAG